MIRVVRPLKHHSGWIPHYFNTRPCRATRARKNHRALDHDLLRQSAVFFRYDLLRSDLENIRDGIRQALHPQGRDAPDHVQLRRLCHFQQWKSAFKYNIPQPWIDGSQAFTSACSTSREGDRPTIKQLPVPRLAFLCFSLQNISPYELLIHSAFLCLTETKNAF